MPDMIMWKVNFAYIFKIFKKYKNLLEYFFKIEYYI